MDEKKKILVVDDELIVREFIQLSLEALGYLVISASDGETALALYNQHRAEISLVMLDMMMPGINGVQLFHLLRGENPQLKCVMISGYADNLDIEALKGEGLAEYIRKPFSFDALAERIDSLLPNCDGRFN